jgi:hypothetical protein
MERADWHLDDVGLRSRRQRNRGDLAPVDPTCSTWVGVRVGTVRTSLRSIAIAAAEDDDG